MKKQDVFDYESDVYALEEVLALIYFLIASKELDDMASEALGGIYRQLEQAKSKMEELFKLAIELQEEAKE